jgi:hypothetical protein
LPADAFEQDHAAGEVPPFLAKAPDVEELRKREREMHLAQMRAEAQAREDTARQEREARGEAASQQRDADEIAKAEPAPMMPRPAEPRAATAPVETRPAPAQPVQPRPVATPPEAPRVDTREMLDSAGLLMVETRADKAPSAAPAEEPVQLGRPRRERPRPAGEEQLVQVETKN